MKFIFHRYNIYYSDLNNFFLWKTALYLINSNINWILIILPLLLRKYSFYWIGFLIYNIDYVLEFELTNPVNTIVSTLTNGLFLVHPFFISFTYILLFEIVFNKNVKLKKLIISSFSAIILGGLWANQELGWGGWWSWDSVEIINLIICLMVIEKVHTNIKSIKMNEAGIFTFLLIIFFHSCVRYDLCDSIHNFTTNFYIEYVFVINVLIFATFFIKTFKNNINIIKIHTSTIIILLNTYLLILILIPNMSFLYKLIWFIYIYVIVCYLVWIFTKNFYVMLNYSLLNYLFVYLFSFIKLFKVMREFYLHFMIITFIIVYLVSNNLDYLYYYKDKIELTEIVIDDIIKSMNNNLVTTSILNDNVLWEIPMGNIKYISSYLYILVKKALLTSNFASHSIYIYYYEYFLIITFIITIQLAKNIIINNKYKIWCI